VIGHLGTRVSALLDGQLPAQDEERAWDHVHSCHLCRDLVEREGWVKTRLAEFGLVPGAAPSGLKGSLLSAPELVPPGEAYLVAVGAPARSRAAAVAMGSGAVGMAMLGVLLVGTSPASAPSTDRRAPATSLVGSGLVGSGLIGSGLIGSGAGTSVDRDAATTADRDRVRRSTRVP
jgi:hypothetical protein